MHRFIFLISGILPLACNAQPADLKAELLELEKERVLTAADAYLAQSVQTITGARSERSAGGIHDYHSEGDYWWPDPANAKGPYIQKDGLTNPDNFNEHRLRMRRLSIMVPALVAAYTITKNEAYAGKALEHINAWFVADSTKMSPHMLYSQAIYGRVTGRGIGIIDAIHLVEVVKAMMVLEEENLLKGEALKKSKDWFRQFNTWITTHSYGLAEKNNGNNHSTCWALQVAMYARFTSNDSLINHCKDFYRQVLLPSQMASDGSFPREIQRTKPYGYSLFNLDAMYSLLHVLSTDSPGLWNYDAGDSLHIKSAMDFMFPYVASKQLWPYPPDVMYFDDWPMRHPSLLFAYLAFGEEKYLRLWKTLPADSEEEEVVRNFFVRQPLLWLE